VLPKSAVGKILRRKLKEIDRKKRDNNTGLMLRHMHTCHGGGITYLFKKDLSFLFQSLGVLRAEYMASAPNSTASTGIRSSAACINSATLKPLGSFIGVKP